MYSLKDIITAIRQIETANRASGITHSEKDYTETKKISVDGRKYVLVTTEFATLGFSNCKIFLDDSGFKENKEDSSSIAYSTYGAFLGGSTSKLYKELIESLLNTGIVHERKRTYHNGYQVASFSFNKNVGNCGAIMIFEMSAHNGKLKDVARIITMIAEDNNRKMIIGTDIEEGNLEGVFEASESLDEVVSVTFGELVSNENSGNNIRTIQINLSEEDEFLSEEDEW